MTGQCSTSPTSLIPAQDKAPYTLCCLIFTPHPRTLCAFVCVCVKPERMPACINLHYWIMYIQSSEEGDRGRATWLSCRSHVPGCLPTFYPCAASAGLFTHTSLVADCSSHTAKPRAPRLMKKSTTNAPFWPCDRLRSCGFISHYVFSRSSHHVTSWCLSTGRGCSVASGRSSESYRSHTIDVLRFHIKRKHGRLCWYETSFFSFLLRHKWQNRYRGCSRQLAYSLA